ncbi:MAG: aminodeoxychorismate/anthranilate synthase component II [candidate division Zixibacteria bacterium]|nr:aminodeoxychorismate/anthranilate synthase component II [candidate division Zixibacteria bacterium]MBU1471006.1 aminodeoxychorismate/anthranilate synthase component II [candidate division Zixibacteria bacterium]MBU2623932.1 aminodeoxychorismate/anthranilate synthase component II [candidate division Zixibacteria bacterium]
MRILIIDNDDSFTGNLKHLIAQRLQTDPVVVPYTRLSVVEPSQYDLIVISAGPGKPSEYTGYRHMLDSDIPILGICLGMQIINEYFGGETARLDGCIHGRTERIEFEGRSLDVARYHSLCVKRVGANLEVIAVNSGGVPMALQHRSKRILGYQFHPESFLTTDGGYFIDYAIDFIHKARPQAVSSDLL